MDKVPVKALRDRVVLEHLPGKRVVVRKGQETHCGVDMLHLLNPEDFEVVAQAAPAKVAAVPEAAPAAPQPAPKRKVR